MQTITVEAVINHEKQIIAELPDDVHIGRVKLTIEPLETPTTAPQALTLEMARAKLQAAGSLSVDPDIPDDLEPLSDEELDALGRSIPTGRPSEELINEDRGEY